MDTGLSLHRPDARLTDLISHYWLSGDSAGGEHLVLPDGCVDLVLRLDRTATFQVFGTRTRPCPVPVTAGASYLGIRFRPGMSRHFQLPPGRFLTNDQWVVSRPADLNPDALATRLSGPGLTDHLNQCLLRWLGRHPPVRQRLDIALRVAARVGHSISLPAWADQANLSPRHLERLFREHVGLTPKTYLNIRRAQRVLALLTGDGERLTAGEAALAAGYADQSHCTRDLRRYMGVTPSAPDLDHHDVAFVQDISPCPGQTESSST
ncbi:Bifunctional transcriptional activator/DNA repair enzyme Ada [Alcanivorax sp. ALC70]|nr:Bifunctional transcriptional activator/DNA repair enzyme Ada [Alcanivorax sp. ALC70]